MNKDKIKAIIDGCLHSPGPTPHMTTDQRVDAAAEAIAALLESQSSSKRPASTGTERYEQ